MWCLSPGPHADTASGCQNLQCGFRACCRSGEWSCRAPTLPKMSHLLVIALYPGNTGCCILCHLENVSGWNFNFAPVISMVTYIKWKWSFRKHERVRLDLKCLKMSISLLFFNLKNPKLEKTKCFVFCRYTQFLLSPNYPDLQTSPAAAVLMIHLIISDSWSVSEQALSFTGEWFKKQNRSELITDWRLRVRIIYI